MTDTAHPGAPRDAGASGVAPGNARIASLDVLRGLAVLGILAVNAPYFAAPWQTGINPSLPPLDVDAGSLWSWYVPHVFFELKFVTLFSMLFGTSIFLVGGDGGDPARNGVLLRRLLWLGAFGLVHALLIWNGDILLLYALCGLVCMSLRKWQARTLMQVGLLLFAFSTLMMCSTYLMSAEMLAPLRSYIWSPEPGEIARTIEAYQSGLVGATAANAGHWPSFFLGTLVGFGARTVGMMMIGLALYKLGFLSGRAGSRVYIVVACVGALALAAIAWQAWINWRAGFDFVHMQRVGTIANVVLSPLVTLGYASVLLLALNAGVLGRIGTALSAVGRLAFTNYLTQSLIMTTIFWGGRGFGLFGEVDRPTLMGIVAIVWAVQIVWSLWWLKRYETGPFEWIWRRLSCGEAPPFKRAA